MITQQRPARPEMSPRFLPDAAQRAWAELGASTYDRSTTDTVTLFDPDTVEVLPVPVARWLRHTIAPGTALQRGVQVSMHGDIRIGKWRPFTADQIVAPSGYVWAAEAGRFPMKVRGYDRYSSTTGQMSWRLFGLIPVVNTTGTDVGAMLPDVRPDWVGLACPSKDMYTYHEAENSGGDPCCSCCGEPWQRSANDDGRSAHRRAGMSARRGDEAGEPNRESERNRDPAKGPGIVLVAEPGVCSGDHLTRAGHGAERRGGPTDLEG